MGVIINSRVVNEPDLYRYVKELNPDGSEKHVVCEGARYHVISWSTLGTHCSEPNCEINRRNP